MDRGCIDVRRVPGDVCDAILEGQEPILVGRKDQGERIAVYFHSEDRVGVKFARSALEREEAREEDVLTIIISIEGPTPFTKKECDGRNVQFLFARACSQNVTRHAMVPRHRRVDAPPTGIRVDNLPRILDTDPIVQYFNWPPGTIVHIERKFGGNATIDYFRCVSPASS